MARKDFLLRVFSLLPQKSTPITRFSFHPVRTHEHMMYMAYAYSTRSGDLSRQVGAVIANEKGDISGIGSNDVPRFGGGPYWPHPVEDRRDYRLGYDANHVRKDDIIINAIKSIKEKKVDTDVATGKNTQEEIKTNYSNKDNIREDVIEREVSSGSENIEDEERKLLLREGKEYFKDTGLLDITEYSRATHAEMAALLSCSRNGISSVRKTLYCTTFPCHSCAKHIIDAGIKRVL